VTGMTPYSPVESTDVPEERTAFIFSIEELLFAPKDGYNTVTCMSDYRRGLDCVSIYWPLTGRNYK
jgi:hypothetical protein